MKTARNTAPLVLFLIAVALLALRFGWQWSLAVWLFAALAACAAWLPLCRRGAQRPSETAVSDGLNAWKLPAAWCLSAFMGVQSLLF